MLTSGNFPLTVTSHRHRSTVQLTKKSGQSAQEELCHYKLGRELHPLISHIDFTKERQVERNAFV